MNQSVRSRWGGATKEIKVQGGNYLITSKLGIKRNGGGKVSRWPENVPPFAGGLSDTTEHFLEVATIDTFSMTFFLLTYDTGKLCVTGQFVPHVCKGNTCQHDGWVLTYFTTDGCDLHGVYVK